MAGALDFTEKIFSILGAVAGIAGLVIQLRPPDDSGESPSPAVVEAAPSAPAAGTRVEAPPERLHKRINWAFYAPVLLVVAHLTWIGDAANNRIQGVGSVPAGNRAFWEWTTSHPLPMLALSIGPALVLELMSRIPDSSTPEKPSSGYAGLLIGLPLIMLWYAAVCATTLMVVLDVAIILLR